MNPSRMAFRRDRHIFPAVMNDAHRSTSFFRRCRRLTSQQGRIILLATKTTARHLLYHPDMPAVQMQCVHQRRVNIVRTLHRAINRYFFFACIPAGKHALRLQISLFLIAGSECLLDDLCRPGKSRRHIPLGKMIMRRHSVCFFLIQHRRKFLISHLCFPAKLSGQR